MANSAAAPQTQVKSAALEQALATRFAATKVAAKVDEFASIKSSPVFQAIYSPEIKPEDKPSALAALLLKPQTEAEARATLKEFQAVKEFTAAKRVELAEAMIRSQQSDTQVELQNTIKFLNDGMLQFETLLKPCTEVIDAIYNLSLKDKAYDAYKEITRDKALEDEVAGKRKDISDKVTSAGNKLATVSADLNRLVSEKNWIGMRKASQADIDAKNQEIGDIQKELDDYKNELTALGTGNAVTSELDPDLLESKAAIAKFLNLSNDDVKEQQEELFKSALNFIKTNTDRVGNMRKLLAKDEENILKMVDAGEMLGIIYTGVSDACHLTSEQLKTIRVDLLPKEGEQLTETEKKLRASKLKFIDNYIAEFEKDKTTTMQAAGKVTELQEKLDNLKKGNSEGSELTRVLHTDAIAEVSEGLVATLTSLSTSAIGQSAEVAKANLRRMNALTNSTAQKDSIRNAMGEERRVIEAKETIDSLKSWTDVVNTRGTILKGTFGRLKETLAELQTVSDDAKVARDAAASVAAEVITDVIGDTKKANGDNTSIFDLGKK